MTLQHFRVLSRDKEYRNLLVNGVCVAERLIGSMQVLLFQLSTIYVEVYFNEEGDEIVYTHSFKNTDELEPYLYNDAITRLLHTLY